MKELLDFIILAILYIFIFYKRWKVKGKDVLFINTIMYIYLSFVLYFTLMPIIASLPFIFNHSYVPMNLVPFIDVSDGKGDFIRQVVLNIIMTIPFGFILRKEFPLKNTILISVAIIFGIENLQLLINFLTLYVQYVYDFGDIIIHLISICIGILIYYPIHCLYPKVQSLYNQIANNE